MLQCHSLYVKSLFSELNLSHVYAEMQTCSLEIATDKCFKIMKSEWSCKKEIKPKLRTYNLFKHNMCLEKYLSHNLTPGERSVITKLRLGVLPLAIETGRYINTPLEERLCTLCDINEVETEYHFVFVCRRYEDLRDNLLNILNLEKTYFISMSLADKFDMLFDKPKLFSQYLLKCLDVRRSIMYV